MAGEVCPVCGRESDGVCRRCLVDGLFGDEADVFEMPGDLGGFRLLKRIGRGASGEVWQAFQPGPDREVALKVFLDPRLGGPADRSRFMAEAQALGRLDHPGIVPVYATGEDAGFLFIASRWMKGGTLADRAAAGASRSETRSIVGTMQKLARAVAHAHRHGLVHRDIKPANVLLDPDGSPCLADFGIAVAAGQSEDGSTSGTPAYMAPEQAKGAPVTTAADVYGLGAVMFDLLTGQPPDRSAEDWRRALAGVDPDAAAICRRCLAEAPEDRYPSADELADDLDRWLAGEPVRARPVAPGVRVWKWAKRRPALAALSGLAGFSALALAVLLVAGSDALRRERNVAVAQERLARDHAKRAEQTADALRDHAYAADVYLASRAIEDGQLGVARAMLERHIPRDGERDVRGFEWGTYLAMCEGDDERMFADHRAAVTDVAISPDGRHVASVGRDGRVFVRDLESAKLVISLPDPDAPVGAAEIPLMTRLVAASPEIRSRIFSAEVSPDEARMRGRPSQLGDLTAVAWSPDGTMLATGASGAYLRLWSFPEGQLTGLLPMQTVADLTFSRDGGRLVVLDGYGRQFSVRVYDLESLTTLWVSEPAEPAIAVHEDQLAWMKIGGDAIEVVDLGSFERLSGLPNPQGLSALAFSSEGSALLGLSHDGRAERLWPEDGASLAPDELPGGALRAAVATPRGFAVAGTGQTIVLQSSKDLSIQRVLRGHEDEILSLSVSPDGRMLASGGKDRTVRLWRLDRNEPPPDFGPASTIAIIDHGPDAGSWLGESEQHGVFVGRVSGGGSRVGDTVPRHALAFSRDGKRVATWREDDGLLIEWWDAQDARRVGQRRIAVRARVPWLITAENGWLAVTGPRSALEVFDLESGAPQWMLPGEGAEDMLRMAVSPAGDAVAIFRWPRSIHIGRREGGWSERIQATEGTMGPMRFSPDGRWLATGNDENRVSIFEVATGALGHRLTGHRAPLARLAFTPDGRTLASSSSDRTLRLWHVPTWRELGIIERSDVMGYLGFSEGGSRLMIAPSGQSLRVISGVTEETGKRGSD